MEQLQSKPLAGEALDGQGDELCLDLTGLTFMDSFGARAIIHAVRREPASVDRHARARSATR
jgi:hypothetical protein